MLKIGWWRICDIILELSIHREGERCTGLAVTDSDNALYFAREATIVAAWRNSEPVTTGNMIFKDTMLYFDKLGIEIHDILYFKSKDRAKYGLINYYIMSPYHHYCSVDPPNGFIGHWKSYYASGQLYTEYNIDENGIKSEKWNLYNYDGKRYGECEVSRNGYRVTYFYKNSDNKKKTGVYINGKKSCKWTKYYYDGKIWKEGAYKDGKKIGEWSTYYESGVLHRVDTYEICHGVKSQRHGPTKSWYPNGKFKRGKYYQYGNLNGRYERFNENGSLCRTGQIKLGDKIGIWYELRTSKYLPDTEVPVLCDYSKNQEESDE